MDFGKTMPDEERTRLTSPQTVLKFLDFEQVFVFKICTQISRFSLGEIAETTVLLTGSSGGGLITYFQQVPIVEVTLILMELMTRIP